ncbi:predicted protein [Uncinocarpus reesii 1704]|uniref:Telomerase reverse transcriptase n=1 Tax=Uncinocarpus reesii (strain UAMH 1704) TaxID=336963 RepID=C4K001_UNCRE|nr:uncharacterized protein UREG_07752 [Uncinocarpus reesii 1704]EEP82887.1 predicted protein [Uncinocarpus reesii 1704]
MGKKRKLGARDTGPTEPQKRARHNPKDSQSQSAPPTHPVLSLYYPRVLPLRAYLLTLLPPSSKSRRRKLASLGVQHPPDHAAHKPAPTPSGEVVPPPAQADGAQQDRVRQVAALLDTALVGVLSPLDRVDVHARQREFAAFTQSQFRSSLVRSTDGGATSSLKEIVDFAILTLFNQQRSSHFRPPHLLCHGFQRASGHGAWNQEHGAMAGIPGLVPQYPNKNVSMLKAFPWTDVLDLLGANCEEIMLHLLLDCGLFISLDPSRGTYYQLSGIQMVDLKLLSQRPTKEGKGNPGAQAKDALHSPRTIAFVRNRMFYARPALNAKGEAKLGLQHIHVLNRYPNSNDLGHTVHIMKYIFPRQFGLRNVFTSAVDTRKTAQPFEDYSLREEEIAMQQKSRGTKAPKSSLNKVPKRLRGELIVLIQKLQKRHQHCSYVELLKHYCPIESRSTESQQSDAPLTDFATPIAGVSAFCRAVFQKLIPNDLFGVGEDGGRNREMILRQVDSFIRLRRFESLSLHDVSQGFKINCIRWLIPPRKANSTDKLCLSDKLKRSEIFLEFIYYLFDSLLIPLIRSNFYVTESNVHRNRLFYFRHDVWKKLIEPSVAQLKATVFEEVKKETAARTLSRGALGCGSLRMLPKRAGARPIVNLRKRAAVKSKWNGRMELGPSVNTLLGPVFQVLNCEKAQRSELVGSGMGSARDMHVRLKAFRKRLERDGMMMKGGGRLYFAKLDVQACFDTIPQKRLLQLVDGLISEDEYRVSKYVEVGPSRQCGLDGQPGRKLGKPVRKFVSKAAPSMDFKTPYDFVTGESNLAMKRNAVFVDTGYQKRHETEDLLATLEQHVRNNHVKMGKKYFRQKHGIPQGSVVSGILCTFFYGEHEREELGFLNCNEALLLRLVDDYLLITTDKGLATRFLQVMLEGNPEYGISVALGKTLVNFEATIHGHRIPRLEEGSAQNQFPYCGNLIDTQTLAISKDRTRRQDDLHVCDSLTIELKKNPGQGFCRKALSLFKAQAHAMFFDTQHNSPTAVLAGIYHAFVDSAIKMYAYFRTLSRHHRRTAAGATVSTEMFTRTIAALIHYAARLIRSRMAQATREDGSLRHTAAITSLQIRWLAVQAFKEVLRRKQSRLGETLRWLDGQGRASKPAGDGEAGRLWRIVRDGRMMVQYSRY